MLSMFSRYSEGGDDKNGPDNASSIVWALVSFFFFSHIWLILNNRYRYYSCFIAICAKVWNHVYLLIFASSEAETCSTSIAMTRCSIFIILVVLESPRWYLLHNVYYKPRGLIIKFICERTSFETVQDLGPYFGWNLYI